MLLTSPAAAQITEDDRNAGVSITIADRSGRDDHGQGFQIERLAAELGTCKAAVEEASQARRTARRAAEDATRERAFLVRNRNLQGRDPSRRDDPQNARIRELTKRRDAHKADERNAEQALDEVNRCVEQTGTTLAEAIEIRVAEDVAEAEADTIRKMASAVRASQRLEAARNEDEAAQKLLAETQAQQVEEEQTLARLDQRIVQAGETFTESVEHAEGIAKEIATRKAERESLETVFNAATTDRAAAADDLTKVNKDVADSRRARGRYQEGVRTLANDLRQMEREASSKRWTGVTVSASSVGSTIGGSVGGLPGAVAGAIIGTVFGAIACWIGGC